MSHDAIRAVTSVYGPRSETHFRDLDGLLYTTLTHLVGFTDVATLLDDDLDAETRHSILHCVRALRDSGAISEADATWLPGHLAGQNPQVFGSLYEAHALAANHAWPLSTPTEDRATGLKSLGARRRTTRQFDPASEMSDVLLAQILQIAYGARVAATPAAGGLRANRIDVFIRRGLHWRLADWNPTSETLRNTSTVALSASRLNFALDTAIDTMAPAVIVVVSATPSIKTAKYANRGYRYTVLESGQITQMLHLACVEEGLSSAEWGGFRDAVVQRAIDAPDERLPMSVVLIGRATAEDAPDGHDRHRMEEELLLWQQDVSPTLDLTGQSEPADARGETYICISQIRVDAHDRAGSGNIPEIIASGAGWTTREARLRALGEAVERRATWRYRSEQACPANQVEGQAFDATQLFPSDLPAFRPPPSGAPRFEPFVETSSYEWVLGTWGNKAPGAAPVELVFSRIESSRPLCGTATSSGVASAPTLAGAQEAALFELIERDAFVRAWTSGQPPARRSDLGTAHATEYELISHAGAEVHLLEFDAPVPTAGVAIVDPARGLAFGMATRGTFEEAQSKATIEALTTWLAPTSSESSPASRTQSPAERIRYYQDPDRLTSIVWFLASEPPQERQSRTESSTLDQLFQRTLFIDLTDPDTPFFTVRALCGALRPIWFDEQWRPSDDANPTPHFFG